MIEKSYLAIWERVRNRIETMPIEDGKREDLELITRLLERAQKGETALAESGEDQVVVVNIAIPGIG
ncbi:hypothetical protein K8I61_11190 [bacterium]|nr:hypothetical protein [bacterium]